MNGARLFLVFLAAFFLSFLLSGWVRRHAQTIGMVDIPNNRSLHAKPTPRGGGIAIVSVVSLGIVIGYWSHLLSGPLTTGLCGGGLIVALTGWADDRKSRSPFMRLLLHSAAAAWVVYWVGGLPTLGIGAHSVHLGFVGAILATVGVVWCINLFNFMDGIDGLAAIEAASVGSWGGLLLVLTGSGALALVCFLVAAAALGFLMWNWFPARLFMGDVGSGYLGFVFASVALIAENLGSVRVVWWAVLSGVFLFDATITLVRRTLSGARMDIAHRSHAYQRLVVWGLSHRQVTIAVLVENVVLGLIAVIGIRLRSVSSLMVFFALLLLLVTYAIVETVNPMFGRNLERQQGT
jgi:Fuc2NAc and GlcNAc transferase